MTEITPERRKPSEATPLAPEPAPVPTRAAAVAGERRRRNDTSQTAGMKLAVSEDAKDPNYEYRWLNDEPGRIYAKTVDDDWDLVTADQMNGHADTARNAGEGTPVARVIERGASGVGGQPRKAYLARKRKEHYQEDDRKKQARIDTREEGLRRGQTGSSEGLNGPTSYVPTGGITIGHGR